MSRASETREPDASHVVVRFRFRSKSRIRAIPTGPAYGPRKVAVLPAIKRKSLTQRYALKKAVCTWVPQSTLPRKRIGYVKGVQDHKLCSRLNSGISSL